MRDRALLACTAAYAKEMREALTRWTDFVEAL
jgi:hypothetical protein